MHKKAVILLIPLVMLLLAACSPGPSANTNALPTVIVTLTLPPYTPAAKIPLTAPTAYATNTPAPTLTPTQAATETPVPPTQVPSQPGVVTQVDASANLLNFDQQSYNGVCQATLRFQANIVTNGAAKVTYYWLRSDGTQSPAGSLTFIGSGFQTVTDTWTASTANSSLSAWDKVYIEQPNQQAFSPVTYNLDCNPPVSKPNSGSHSGPRGKP